MIDLHTHILPGVDDGASDVSVSLALLRTLKEEGVDKVVFTPHFYWQENTVSRFLENRKKAYSALCEAGIPEGMEIRLGAEAQFGEIEVSPESLRPFAFDSGNYILIELPFEEEWHASLFKRIENLIYLGNLKPIVAHVERYPAARKVPAKIARLADMGCLIQVNCSSILRAREGGLVNALLSHDQIHCLGSDCHNMTTRRPHYAEAIAALTQKCGAAYVEKLQRNMSDVLSGRTPRVSAASPIRKTLFGNFR